MSKESWERSAALVRTLPGSVYKKSPRMKKEGATFFGESRGRPAEYLADRKMQTKFFEWTGE